MSNRFRTEVESLYLKEMVEEDSNFLLKESDLDPIIPENTEGLFGDTSSEMDIDDILDGGNADLF